ncbi:zinc knuckle CX2CX4HX4C containing protein [Tanacetum coccineum]
MHNVPIVAYSKVGLDLISAKVGKLMRLDAHTNFICNNSWGRSDYARALVEVSADKPLVDSVVIDIPSEDGKGHITVTIRIEFEWQPPRCDTCKIFDHLEILNEDSDTDDEEVFLPNDRTTFPSSSVVGGYQMEEDANDDYEDQFEDYTCSFQEFCDQFDFKVKGLGRK